VAESVEILRTMWCPSACKNCGEAFDAQWLSDYSLSGELVWKCSQCGIPHARTIEALTEDFVQRERSTLAKVDSIRDRALSLGWNEARLYHGLVGLILEKVEIVCFEENGKVYKHFIVRKRHIGAVTPSISRSFVITTALGSTPTMQPSPSTIRGIQPRTNPVFVSTIRMWISHGSRETHRGHCIRPPMAARGAS